VENSTVDLDLSGDGTAEKIARIATSEEVKEKALSIVKRKLGHLLGRGRTSEVHEIAEDALNSVATSLLQAHARKTSSLRIEAELEDETNKISNPIARYLIAGVSNYCSTRLRRWSTENEDGETGTRARYYITSEESDDPEFWDHLLNHADNLDFADKDRINALLSDRGVSEQDIALIERNLAGWSFADIAKQNGGTADKYRRRIQRALESAGIDHQLLR